MTIGITGATGHLGRLVVERLRRKVPPSSVVALVRNTAKASDLDVETREADYEKPETLEKALQGIDTLLLISGNQVGRRAAQHRNVIDAAKKARVTRIVYTSLLRADSSPLNLAEEHFATENAVKESGIPYTILRNGWYAENYTASIPAALAAGAFLGSAGDAKISLAARSDYADAAVAVLTAGGPDGKIYELAGDDAYTLSDLAAEVSRQTGRSLPYRNLPEKEYAAALTGAGLPPPLAAAIASWDVSASQGALYDSGRQLSALIGHPTTPLSESVAEALKQAS
jgi:NAD(P)H dehydrogenase (quinone)